MTQEQAIQNKQEEIAATSSDVEVPEEAGRVGEQFENLDPADGFYTLETLPQDVRSALPEDAQLIFIAAYNSIIEGNGDREAANRVAWQTLEHNEQYAKSSDGKWHHTPYETANHNPSPTTAA